MSNNHTMKTRAYHPEPVAFCPRFHHAIELIGRRWSGAILRVLLDGPTRFSDITGAVPGLSDRLLSESLKELEAEGMVVRTVFPETPVRIEYGLTEKGRALSDVIHAVSTWAEQYRPVWEARIERMADYLHQLQSRRKPDDDNG